RQTEPSGVSSTSVPSGEAGRFPTTTRYVAAAHVSVGVNRSKRPAGRTSRAGGGARARGGEWGSRRASPGSAGGAAADAGAASRRAAEGGARNGVVECVNGVGGWASPARQGNPHRASAASRAAPERAETVPMSKRVRGNGTGL